MFGVVEKANSTLENYVGLKALSCIGHGGIISPPVPRPAFDHFLHLPDDSLRYLDFEHQRLHRLSRDLFKGLRKMASAFLVGLGLATSAFLVSERVPAAIDCVKY